MGDVDDANIKYAPSASFQEQALARLGARFQDVAMSVPSGVWTDNIGHAKPDEGTELGASRGCETR